MPYPPAITLRPCTVGGSTALESGTQLVLSAEITASRSLKWGATGWQFPSLTRTVTGTEGAELSFSLPVTDQDGWRLNDDSGSIIDVSAPGSYTHTYTIKLKTLSGGRQIDERTIGPFALPTEDLSPIDLDLMLPAPTVAGGVVSVPDSWDQRVAAAEAAATAVATTISNEDSAVAGFVTNPASATRSGLDALYVGKSGAAVNVLDFGATGDGVTDDTAAIQAAIATGRPVALMAGATHRISGPLTPAVMYGNGATLEVAANVDALVIGPAAKVRDLNVVTDIAGYSSTAIRFDGTAGFNVLAVTELTNITLDGPGTASGVAIGCNDAGAAKNVVTYVKARSIRARNWQYGIHFNATHAESWMNGNLLDVSMYAVARMVTLWGTCDSNTVEGQLQYSGATEYGVKCNGNSNRLNAMLWDYANFPSAKTYDLLGGSYNKVITDAVARTETLPGANPTNEINFDSRSSAVLPKVRDRAQFPTRNSTLQAYESFNGQQDDVLKMAHKNFTVTSTVAPTSGGLDRAFSFGPLPVAWTLADGATVTLTINATAAPLVALHVIGVLFANNDRPDYVKIETEDATAAVTVRYEAGSAVTASTINDPLNYTRGLIAGTVAKIHVTFSVVTGKTVRIGSVFAASGQATQKSFLTTDGGKTWGDVEFGETAKGIILKSPDGTRYRVTAANGGTLTVTAV